MKCVHLMRAKVGVSAGLPQRLEKLERLERLERLEKLEFHIYFREYFGVAGIWYLI